jgi:hypothetical protein
MKHFASRAFWEAYDRLPKQVCDLADRTVARTKKPARFGGDEEPSGPTADRSKTANLCTHFYCTISKRCAISANLFSP